MESDVVENDDIAGRQGWGQLGLDVDFEDLPVHRRIDDPWRCESVASQSGNEGLCFPRAERCMAAVALAAWRPACAFGQFRAGRGFIDEDEPWQGLVEEWPPAVHPQIAFTADIEALPLAGLQAFFYG